MLAVQIVRGLISAELTALGQTVFLERDKFDAITESELPATLIDEPSMVEVTNNEGTVGGAAYHAAVFLLSFAAVTSAVAQTNFNAALTRLSANYNLAVQGVIEVLPISYGGDDDTGKDITSISLEIRVRFLTPPNDFGTLLT